MSNKRRTKNKENDNSTKNAFSDIYKLVAETLT